MEPSLSTRIISSCSILSRPNPTDKVSMHIYNVQSTNHYQFILLHHLNMSYNSTVATRLGRRRIPIHTTLYWGYKVNILFHCWPGNSAAMYAVALMLVFAMAVLVEWLSFTNIVKLKPGGSNRVVEALLTTGLYGVRSGLSYLVMLAVMSFNGGVFLAAIGGHVIGFLIFGTQAFRKKSLGGLDSSKL